jgi:hypothetical protein
MKKSIYSAIIAAFLFTADSTHSEISGNNRVDKTVCCSKKKLKNINSKAEQEGLICFPPGPVQF